MENYPPNSNMSKAQVPATLDRPKIAPLVNGVKTHTKNKTLSATLYDIQRVATTVANVINAISNGIFGKSSPISTFTDNLPMYRSYYNQINGTVGAITGKELMPFAKKAYSYNNIAFASEEEATMILVALKDILGKYGLVRVSEFYELANVESSSTDYNYGWVDLRPAYVQSTAVGYSIHFPRVIPLD